MKITLINILNLRHELGSDAYWECMIRAQTGPENHQAGTCSLGKVVDPELRVFDVQNLRVADASIIPILPNSNPSAAIIAIAEKAADMISRQSL